MSITRSATTADVRELSSYLQDMYTKSQWQYASVSQVPVDIPDPSWHLDQQVWKTKLRPSICWIV